MSAVECLPAEARPDAEILILGSMPGQISLQREQYYANPRNAFWFIMGKLFGAYPEKPYHERLAILQDRKIALWDVLQGCTREGSLDAAIKDETVNEFAPFLAAHPKLTAVFFNGKQAERSFSRSKTLLACTDRLHRFVLPSTSAALGRPKAQKIESWRVAFAESGVPTLPG